MLNRLILSVGPWGCLALLAASVLGQPPGPLNPPPPTFFVPPGSPTNGALIPPIPPGGPTDGALIPPIPPGVAPPVFWHRGDGPPEVIKPSDHWVGLQCVKAGEASRRS